MRKPIGRNPNSTCEYCKEGFYIRPSRKGKYCSWECYLNATGYKTYPIYKNCENSDCCNFIIIQDTWQLDKKYCSNHCAASVSNLKRVGKKYTKAVSFRKMMLALYDNKCAICGYEKFLDVHHILPRSKGGLNVVKNGVILCPNHHREAHGGLLSESYLIELALNKTTKDGRVV